MTARSALHYGLVVIAAVLPACSSSTPRASAGVSSCEPDGPFSDRPIGIVTTVAPITNIVSIIAAGSGADVQGIVPEGVNSHTHEPGPAAAQALEQAEVVFLNGLDLEASTKRFALTNVSDASVVCELGDETLARDDYIFDFSFPESAGSPNPHLWTNPPMARGYAQTVRDVLSVIDPDNAELYQRNDRAFAERIDELDAAMRTATATLAPHERLLLTYHDAYAYFAEEYGWTIVGAVQPSSFNEPTPRELAALIEQVRSLGVSTIFGSEVFPSPVLRQIANETGVTYIDDLRDDDLPGDAGDPNHSWLGLMQFNLVTIVEALGGDARELRQVDITPVARDDASYAP